MCSLLILELQKIMPMIAALLQKKNQGSSKDSIKLCIRGDDVGSKW